MTPDLPKHLRPRWRYLAVGLETTAEADLDRREFQWALWYAAGDLLGDAGSARADLSVLGFAFESPAGEAVVRARRGQVGPARAALACVSAVGGEPVGVRVRGVSGTVRACEEKFCPWLADDGPPAGRSAEGANDGSNAGEGQTGRDDGGSNADGSGDGEGGTGPASRAAGSTDDETYLARARERPKERTVAFGGDERPAVVRGERVDFPAGGVTGATRFDLE